MKTFLLSLASLLVSTVSSSYILPAKPATVGPFLKQLNGSTWVIGNELWNVTQGQTYGTKLYYKDHDCVGDAAGHYVSYSESILHSVDVDVHAANYLFNPQTAQQAT